MFEVTTKERPDEKWYANTFPRFDKNMSGDLWDALHWNGYIHTHSR
jgi:hypothetical protein